MSLKGDGLKLRAFTRSKRPAPTTSWFSLPLITRNEITISVKCCTCNQYLFLPFASTADRTRLSLVTPIDALEAKQPSVIAGLRYSVIPYREVG